MEINNKYSLESTNFKSNKDQLETPKEDTLQQAQETTQNNQVSFTGIGLKQMFIPLKEAIHGNMKPKNTKEHKEFLVWVADILGVDEKRIQKMAVGKTNRQFAFLNAMTEHYNGKNFKLPQEQRDNPDTVLDLFSRIAKPDKKHIGFIYNTHLSMTNVKECFDKLGDNPEELSKMEEIYHSLRFAGKNRDKIAMDIVNSPNAKEYVNNYGQYKDFVNAHIKEENVISVLDSKLAKKAISTEDSHKIIKLNEIITLPKELLSAQDLLPKYSKEGNEILSMLQMKIAPSAKTLEKSGTQSYVNIYGSTTSENINFRKNFLENNYVNRITIEEEKQLPAEEIHNIETLFDMADKDPHTMNFLNGMSAAGATLKSAGQYLEIIDKYGAKELAKNVKNVAKAARSNYYEPLKEVTEYMDTKPNSVGESVSTFFKGLFSKKQKPVQQTGDIVTLQKPVQTEIKETEQKVEQKIEEKVEQKINNEADERFMPKSTVENKTSEAIDNEPKIEDKSVITQATVKPAKPKLTPEEYSKKIWADFFKKYPPKQPTAKQLKITSDIKPILEKKLGSKTLSEQERVYTLNATKQRASMLPEIFESIKETRAVARKANGGKLPYGFSQNSDAVDLYTKINGKNKKLVNYMLKVRDESGNRRYTVKDIMNKLNDANKEILKGKKASTKENRFTAKDEKAIYDIMLEEQIAQYGKLPRTKRVSKK